MKRNSVLVLGLGMLLGAGLLAPGCGDSDSSNKPGNDGGLKDAKLDGVKDTGTPDGAKGTGGVIGTGGAIIVDGGFGGATGFGGAGGAVRLDGSVDSGFGGATGTGGATTVPQDGGLDTGPAIRLDGAVVDVPKPDTKDGDIDAPLPNPDGIDAIDGQPVTIDTKVPQIDTGALDVTVDVTPVSLDAALDQGIDAGPALDAVIDVLVTDAEFDGGTDI